MNEKNKANQPKKTRRSYDAEFKRSAADMALAGKSIAQVARDLGISPWTLNRWKNRRLSEMGSAEVNGELRSAKDLDAENRALRKELEYVKRQREILKKAMSILGEEPTGGMR